MPSRQVARPSPLLGVDPAQPGAACGRGCRDTDRRRAPADPAAVAITALADRLAAEPRGLAGPARCRSGRTELGQVASLSNGGGSSAVKGMIALCGFVSAPAVVTAAAALAARTVGHGGVVEKCLADDAPRIVLTRVERAPVDVVEVRAHLVAHPRLRAADRYSRARLANFAGSRRSEAAARARCSSAGDQSDQQKLLDREPEEHALQVTAAPARPAPRCAA